MYIDTRIHMMTHLRSPWFWIGLLLYTWALGVAFYLLFLLGISKIIELYGALSYLEMIARVSFFLFLVVIPPLCLVRHDFQPSHTRILFMITSILLNLALLGNVIIPQGLEEDFILLLPSFGLLFSVVYVFGIPAYLSMGCGLFFGHRMSENKLRHCFKIALISMVLFIGGCSTSASMLKGCC